MQKTIRIQPVSEQDRNLRKELHQHTPSQRMEMLMQWIDQTSKNRRLKRVATIRHVPLR
ncbi:MAG: hypothetical protein JJU29_17795 [Verrucomicrobia bacterium]|nr:hypothetical protein [Verrucomicrobiota bacterium]